MHVNKIKFQHETKIFMTLVTQRLVTIKGLVHRSYGCKRGKIWKPLIIIYWTSKTLLLILISLHVKPYFNLKKINVGDHRWIMEGLKVLNSLLANCCCCCYLLHSKQCKNELEKLIDETTLKAKLFLSNIFILII